MGGGIAVVGAGSGAGVGIYYAVNKEGSKKQEEDRGSENSKVQEKPEEDRAHQTQSVQASTEDAGSAVSPLPSLGK